MAVLSMRTPSQNPLNHPLVEAGLIPPDLAEVLTRPTFQRATRRKVAAKARVITGEEYERLLQEKEQQLAATREAKEQRPRQRRARASTISLGITDPAAASRGAPSCRGRPSSCCILVLPSALTNTTALLAVSSEARSDLSARASSLSSATFSSRKRKRKAPAPVEGKQSLIDYQA
ncbi:hypothetical protein AALO_G00077270 [Alosa alosa]|uniref:Uncharacterized protein n=1 Tax=Alosa alosa TaxID=278164 RepID=A0AAV6GX12_9TELE|nr:hypothetical protein AALO_G00077270 [Alosa alosa]